MNESLEADYYETLGVSPDVDNDTLKRAYWRLARLLHPDTNPNAGERFKEVSKAYETLADPARRSAYNQARFGTDIAVSERGTGAATTKDARALAEERESARFAAVWRQAQHRLGEHNIQRDALAAPLTRIDRDSSVDGADLAHRVAAAADALVMHPNAIRWGRSALEDALVVETRQVALNERQAQLDVLGDANLLDEVEEKACTALLECATLEVGLRLIENGNLELRSLTDRRLFGNTTLETLEALQTRTGTSLQRFRDVQPTRLRTWQPAQDDFDVAHVRTPEITGTTPGRAVDDAVKRLARQYLMKAEKGRLYARFYAAESLLSENLRRDAQVAAAFDRRFEIEIHPSWGAAETVLPLVQGAVLAEAAIILDPTLRTNFAAMQASYDLGSAVQTFRILESVATRTPPMS